MITLFSWFLIPCVTLLAAGGTGYLTSNFSVTASLAPGSFLLGCPDRRILSFSYNPHHRTCRFPSSRRKGAAPDRSCRISFNILCFSSLLSGKTSRHLGPSCDIRIHSHRALLYGHHHSGLKALFPVSGPVFLPDRTFSRRCRRDLQSSDSGGFSHFQRPGNLSDGFCESLAGYLL